MIFYDNSFNDIWSKLKIKHKGTYIAQLIFD